MNYDQKVAYLKRSIRNVPNFPKEGIQFKDITTLLSDPKAIDIARELLCSAVDKKLGITQVVGLESRGFFFGPMLADELKVGFVPIRKPGKLPFEFISESYELEYGVNELQMHTDAIHKGDKVLIHDDLLATGGSALAAARLVERLGGEVVFYSFIIELGFLDARAKLEDAAIGSLIVFN